MKILYIGGSGNISSACTEVALSHGHDVFHFNRGNTSPYTFDNRVKIIHGDINKISDRKQLDQFAPFDVAVDFICFTPDQMQADIEYFSGNCNQFIFISSATVYKKPPDHYIVTEDCPLQNNYWLYSRNKIACEQILSGQQKLPYTIVRPSYTFGKTWIPVAFTAREYNPIYRIKQGLPLISHGDGESLWVMTHHTDFARAFIALFGNKKAINNHFHITSDEVLTWDQIYKTIGKVLGIEPKLIHIPSDYINKIEPDWGDALLGDKARSMVFDNSKIKNLVPGWHARKSFAEGIKESIAWFEESQERMQINAETEQKTNNILLKFSSF
jgi:nucleoside-diphosphate-sugar epimerase